MGREKIHDTKAGRQQGLWCSGMYTFFARVPCTIFVRMNSWFTTDYYSDPKKCAKMKSTFLKDHRIGIKKRTAKCEIMGGKVNKTIFIIQSLTVIQVCTLRIITMLNKQFAMKIYIVLGEFLPADLSTC